MSLTAAVPSAGGPSGVLAASPSLATLSAGLGGILIAGSLIILLAYLNVIDASEIENQTVRTLLVALIPPVGAVFGAILLFRSLQAL